MPRASVENYYNEHANDEWERLDRHRTEFGVTLKAFEEFLPSPPLDILDIGGGPGRYALALSAQGHNVSLLDLSQANLALARQKSVELDVPLADIRQADALTLEGIADASYDAALLMGPLYHLVSEADRANAVRQVMRVLKPGGLIFAAFITRYAPFRDYAANDPLAVYREKDQWGQMWLDGINFGNGFTDAYFSMPAEVIPLMQSQGVSTIQVLGVEGITAGHEDAINQLQGEEWEFWLEWNYRFAKDTALYAAANHLLYIGTKGRE